jgi:hypothetical protein
VIAVEGVRDQFLAPAAAGVRPVDPCSCHF